MMNKVFYPAVFHPEEVGFSVSVPDIDGCFSEGDTMEEAMEMTFDAIGLCLELQRIAHAVRAKYHSC